jgi:hypothetical protein
MMRSDVERSGSNLVSAGCGVLFGLPFALMGLYISVAVLWQLSQGAWKDAAVGSIYALMFCGVGFGLIILSIRDPFRTATPALEASAPGEPWRWRPDWAAGRIVSADRQELRYAWVFAVVLILPSSSLYFVLPGELRSGNWKALVALIFPLVGIYLLILAVKATLRWRRFGASTLEMAETPAAIGGRLVGRITSERLPAGAASIKLRLACLRIEKHDRSTTERVIWEAEKTLTDYPIHFSGGIPVAFDIPADCEPASAARSALPYIRWMLQATAEVPGVDYAPKFDVPVFRTSAPAITSAEDPGPGRR